MFGRVGGRSLCAALLLTSMVTAALVWSVGDRSTIAEAAPGAAEFEPMDGAVHGTVSCEHDLFNQSGRAFAFSCSLQRPKLQRTPLY